MCDCEELDYDDFVTMLNVVKGMSAPVETEKKAEPVPLLVSTKRSK